MSDNLTSVKKQLTKIIEEKKIYPVYQPIVSLKSGELLGYEALSRISLEPCSFNVEEMFTYAEKFECLWNLEYICRKKALKEIKDDKTVIFTATVDLKPEVKLGKYKGIKAEKNEYGQQRCMGK